MSACLRGYHEHLPSILTFEAEYVPETLSNPAMRIVGVEGLPMMIAPVLHLISIGRASLHQSVVAGFSRPSSADLLGSTFSVDERSGETFELVLNVSSCLLVLADDEASGSLSPSCSKMAS